MNFCVIKRDEDETHSLSDASPSLSHGAADRARTGNNQLGKLVRYHCVTAASSYISDDPETILLPLQAALGSGL